MNVTALSSLLGWSIPLVSGHLRVLRKCHLVEFEQRHQEHIYRLADGVCTSVRGNAFYLDVACTNKTERMILKIRRASIAKIAE